MKRAMASTSTDPSHWNVAARAAFLTGVRLFERVPPATVAEIAARFQPKPFRQGAFIYLEGDPAETLDLLVTGRISVIRETESGQSVILRLIGPGEFFGWAGGWGEPVYSASAVAKESGVLLQLPAHEFSALVTSAPGFALAVIQELGARLREAEARITDLQTAQVERRIAVVLLRLAQKSGIQTAAGVQLSARLTRRDVADLAGTTLSTASRILSTWHHRGVIAGGREHIVILQPDALVRVVEEGPLHGRA